MTGFASSCVDRGLRVAGLAGDFAGDLACEAVKGVDMARVRGLTGTIFPLTCVSDSDVYRERAEERTLRRDAATDGAEDWRGMGTLF